MFFDDDPSLSLSAPQTSSTKEYTGVLLVGSGHSLYPCTDDASLPKGLLPIANRPMMEWALTWLEEGGIKDVLVLTLAPALDKLAHYLRNVYEGSLNCTVEATEDIGSGLGQPLGTAQVLAKFKDRITKDFIVISCDTIITIPPELVLNYHRSHDPLMTVVYANDLALTSGPILPTSEGDLEESKNFVGIYSESKGKGKRLVHTINSEDCSDDFELRMSLLWKFPKVTFSTRLEDAHVYIFKKTILDLLVIPLHARQMLGNSSLAGLKSVREDLIPFLLKCQYQTQLVKKYGLDRILKGVNTSTFPVSSGSPTFRSGSPDISKTPSGLVTPETNVYANGDHGDHHHHPHRRMASQSPTQKSSLVKCMVFVNPSEDYICSRANTLGRFSNLNRWALKNLTSDQARISSSCQLSSSASVGSDSIVGDSTRIEDRSSIKKSCIGSHVVIGKYVKIISSIVMDHVIIEDGCKLENCILGQDARILEKTTLKNCEVAPGYTVPKETNAKDEKLVRFGD